MPKRPTPKLGVYRHPSFWQRAGAFITGVLAGLLMLALAASVVILIWLMWHAL